MSYVETAATREEVSTSIIELLELAEEGPHALRKAMVALNIQGAPKSAVGCIVANYLGQTCPGWDFAIAADSIYGWRGDSRLPDEEIEFKPPSKSFAQFIAWFDRGLLPELIECQKKP